MARESFIQKRFMTAAKLMIVEANKILEEYKRKGLTMTLRQLHYQFVARKVMILTNQPRDPAQPNKTVPPVLAPYPNTQQSYKRLGGVMSDARLAGLTDWDHMEDRVRSLEALARWDSPSEIVDAVAYQYREDQWKGQKYRPEVWIEKDALAGVIENICNEFRIDYFACRGNVSQSAQYIASKRFLRYIRNGQTPIILHFGDHDPSGLDMTRDNREKMRLLTGHPIEVRRLALNWDQIERYNPPPNPVKFTDSRAAGYVDEFGEESWELDALDPDVLEALIRDEVEPLIDDDAWRRAKATEDEGKEDLALMASNWAAALEYVKTL